MWQRCDTVEKPVSAVADRKAIDRPQLFMVPGQDDVRRGLEEQKVGRSGGHRHLGGFIEQQQVEPGAAGSPVLDIMAARRPSCIQVPL